MADIIPFPYKRRTRGHVIADLSMNFVERLVFENGFTAERIRQDYGYDLFITTHDEVGYIEPGKILIQIKASESLRLIKGGTVVSFRIDLRDVGNWMAEPLPVFLVLFDAGLRRGYWLYVQRYFERHGMPRSRLQREVAVHVPAANRLNRRFVALARRWKQDMLKQVDGVIHHG